MWKCLYALFIEKNRHETEYAHPLIKIIYWANVYYLLGIVLNLDYVVILILLDIFVEENITINTIDCSELWDYYIFCYIPLYFPKCFQNVHVKQ